MEDSKKMMHYLVAQIAQTLQQGLAPEAFLGKVSPTLSAWLRPIWWEADGSPKEALADLQTDPKDEINIESVVNSLAKALRKDPSLEGALQALYRALAGDAPSVQITHSKNVVTGTITAGGNVHVGDQHHSYTQAMTTPEVSPNERKKILFIAANPKGTTALNLNEEYMAIKDKLEKQQQHYELLLPVLSATTQDFVEGLAQQPQIVHFSGHGEQNGIYLENEEGYYHLVSGQVQSYFRPLQGLQLVILNCCYSAELAKEISAQGAYVVGYDAPVHDSVAIDFVTGFYGALSKGASVKQSVALAKARIVSNHPTQTAQIALWHEGAIVG